MAEPVSSEQTQTVNEGVQASPVIDTNDYKAMAATAQSGNDKYVALTGKYGNNVDEQLQNLSDFQAQLNDNPQDALNPLVTSYVGEGYGITQKQQQPEVSAGNDRMNPFEIDQEGTYSNKKFMEMVDAKATKIVDARLERAEGLRKLDSMRSVLTANGITDPRQQEKEIERYYRPQVDFKTYAESRKPQQGVQAGAIQQVEQTQSQPQTAGVLQGGIPVQLSEDDTVVKQVADVELTGSSAAFGKKT